MAVLRRIRHQGRFIKPCPGTPEHVCCGYRIVHFAEGCSLGCSYCVLRDYFGEKEIRLFANREKLFDEFRKELGDLERIVRYGTGEFTDSLLLDEAASFHQRLIGEVAGHTRAVLEIKTKTTNIGPLLGVEDKRNVIMAWSLNSQHVARREERGSPSVVKRTEAALRARDAGFRLAFHFDPIIMHRGWEEEYGRTIGMLFERISPEDVVYISMGALRFTPRMRDILDRSKARYLYEGEFVKGRDNKLRYFRPLRTGMFRVVRDQLLRHVPDERLYLCMESPEVWEDVFGIVNMTSGDLARRLDRACGRAFPHLSV
jgi:spore photoproduct lyase